MQQQTIEEEDPDRKRTMIKALVLSFNFNLYNLILKMIFIQ